MVKPGKRLRQAGEKIKDSAYALEEALGVLADLPKAKFTETVDVAACLNLDQKGNQPFRGALTLPAGTGKNVRVAVFAAGEKAKEATAAGAEIVGAEDLLERIQKGGIDFDVCIAAPDMMGFVGRLGPVLGPKGLMPNPKLGTVTMDVAGAVKSAKGGRITYKADKAAVVHAGIGKASFSSQDLASNIRSFFDALEKARPAGLKGLLLKKAFISTTMGPSIRLSLDSLKTP